MTKKNILKNILKNKKNKIKTNKSIECDVCKKNFIDFNAHLLSDIHNLKVDDPI